MTDARHPERWLNDRRFLKLSADAYKLHSFAMMYAVSNRTDGRLDPEDFLLMAGVDSSKVSELEACGLLKWTRGKWLLTEYRDTQTSKSGLDALDAQRRRDREKKARKRAREAAASAASAESSPGERSPGASPGTSVGQDSARTGRYAAEPEELPDDDHEDDQEDEHWAAQLADDTSDGKTLRVV